MKNLRLIVSLFLIGLLGLAGIGCEDKLDPVDAGGNQSDGLPDLVTYTEHVKSLLDMHCSICHSTQLTGADRFGAPPGVNTDTYTEAVASGQRSNIRIQAGTMPPAGALGLYDRQLFQKWIDQGMQE